MDQKQIGTSVLRFSTDELPKKDRITNWVEVIERQFLKMEFHEIPETPFSQTVVLQSLPGFSMITGVGGGYHAHRTRELIADGCDNLVLIIHLEGCGQFSQFGREVAVGAGQAVLLSGDHVFSAFVPGTVRYIAIGVPRRVLWSRANNPECAFLNVVQTTNEALRMLIRYIHILNCDDMLTKTIDTRLQNMIVTHVCNMIEILFNFTKYDTENKLGKLREARLYAIKNDILTCLDQENLSLAMMAERHSVSIRYIQKLFEFEGMTFSEYVRTERLAKAHRMLVDPQLVNCPIGVIGYEAGFTDLSHFNRAFRRRYGATPSDVRASSVSHSFEKTTLKQ